VRVYLNGGEDLGTILNRVVAAGGQVVMPKTHLRDDIGYIGMFSDSEGNVIGLLSMA
jgi:predicted enzyme related to lactoylglutathione lyase